MKLSLESDAEVVKAFLCKHRGGIANLRQCSLMSELSLLQFLRAKGFSSSGVASHDLDKLLKMKLLDFDGYDLVGQGSFHPFRFFPVSEYLRVMTINIATNAVSRCIESSSDITVSQSYMPKVETIRSTIDKANLIANLAVVLEPVYWPQITGSVMVREESTIERRKDEVGVYKSLVQEMVTSLDGETWQKLHENIRHKAAFYDDNHDVYLLLRLSPWSKRERIKGWLGHALWLRHMAETIRLAFEEVSGAQWAEEDESFGYWHPGSRKHIYGTERPTQEQYVARSRLAFEFGLHTASILRWYVEGETEYHAIAYLLPGASKAGIELINLRGAIKARKGGAALSLSDNLKKDCELRRLSFITFDKDRSDNVRTIASQVDNGNVVGYINCNDPDFEFSNFTLEELIDIAISMDKELELDTSKLELGDWSGVGSGKDFERKYKLYSEYGRGIKGKLWGEALGKYAADNPRKSGTKEIRPIIAATDEAIHGLRVRYEDQREHVWIDPSSFTLNII